MSRAAREKAVPRVPRKTGRPAAHPEVKKLQGQVHATDLEWGRYAATARLDARAGEGDGSVSDLFRRRLADWIRVAPGPDCARGVDRGDEGDLRPHNVYATRAQWAECDRLAAEQGVSRSQFVRALMAGPGAWK